MCHCQICNFCETTPGASLDPLSARANNKVKYYEDLKQWLCTDCRDITFVNCDEYYNEFNEIETEDIDRKEICEDALALSEL